MRKIALGVCIVLVCHSLLVQVDNLCRLTIDATFDLAKAPRNRSDLLESAGLFILSSDDFFSDFKSVQCTIFSLKRLF